MSTTKSKVAEPKGLGKVMYRYIPRKIRGITNPNHVLYDGKNESSIDKFYVIRDASGRWKFPLTEIEKNWLQDKLLLSDEDLNTSNANNPYFQGIVVEMPKHGIALDTRIPGDFLIDKVLQSYDNVIAPNSGSKKYKASYRYVRLKESEETKVFLKESDLKKDMYKQLGALEESRERMIMYLLNDGMRMNPNISTDDLKKLVNENAESKPALFVKTLGDPLFTEKGLLNMAKILKVVTIKSGLHYYQDLPLAFEGQVANLDNAAMFLKDSLNGDIKLAISEKVLDDFNRIK
jgi:hypothetical protein